MRLGRHIRGRGSSLTSASIGDSPVGGTINATVGTFNALGTGIVSSGFPLIRGSLFEQDVIDRRVVVRVGGIEKACYVESIRGRYSDGSLRSILIQFSHNTASTTTWEDAEVELGGSARTLADISYTPQTTSLFLDGRNILPKDVSYTKNCWASFYPILDASQETSVHTGLLVDQFNDKWIRSSNGEAEITDGEYQSTYETPLTFIKRWQALGSTLTGRSYWWVGVRKAYYFLTDYGLQAQGAGSFSPELNTNGLTTNGSSSGVTPPEHHTQAQISLASAYLLTGMIEFWNYLCARASWFDSGISSQAIANNLGEVISPTYLPRFNLRGLWSVALSAVIDNTKAWTSNVGGWTGRSLGGAAGAPTQLPWYINAWITHKYARGDYRDNQVGCDDNITDSGGAGGYPAGIGAAPNFQFSLSTQFLLFWYLNIEASDAIADMIQTNVNAVWDNNVIPLISGEPNFGAGATHGHMYWQRNVIPSRPTPEGVSPYTLSMWADTIAFCKAKFGDAKYTTYLAISMAEANMEGDNSGGSLGGIGNLTWGNKTGNWNLFWKLHGECFAYACSAPFFDIEGLPTGLPTSIRTPTQY